jgi:apolipoprotein N-acyltransferase
LVGVLVGGSGVKVTVGVEVGGVGGVFVTVGGRVAVGVLVGVLVGACVPVGDGVNVAVSWGAGVRVAGVNWVGNSASVAVACAVAAVEVPVVKMKNVPVG